MPSRCMVLMSDWSAVHDLNSDRACSDGGSILSEVDDFRHRNGGLNFEVNIVDGK